MRARAPRSVRRRILLGVALVLGVLTAGLAALAQRFAARAADEAFDRVLAAAALSIAETVGVEDEALNVDVPYAALAMLGRSRTSRVFYRVLDPAGSHLTGHAELEGPPGPPPLAEPVFAPGAVRGTPVRVAAVGRVVAWGEAGPERTGTGVATVLVAETLEARTALAREITRNAVLAPLALGALALGLVFVGLGRAFAPFRAIEAELRRREPTDLRPLQTALPREAAPLLGAINGFMLRLGETLDRLRGLAADAAHQIRTPLAAVRAQSELALAETDPAAVRARLERVHANALAASHVVNQVLADATLAHRLATRAQAPVDLIDLVEEVEARLDEGDAARLALDVSGLGPDGEAIVLGDRFALSEMLANLLGNALRYSDGPVVVGVARRADASGGEMSLFVEDAGPGVPDAEKPLVTRRFQRGRAGAGLAGSGLGLSIAQAAAEASGGRLELLDGPRGGLLVRAVWPAGASARAADKAVPPPTVPTKTFPPERGRPQARTGGARAASFAAWSLAAGLGLLVLAAASRPAGAQAADGTASAVLRIGTDGEEATLRRLAAGFRARRPDVVIEISTLDAGLLAQSVVTASAARAGPDLAVGAAVDRMVGLVNDGHARPHRSAETARLPSWARWRDELFGFTFEPVLFVFDPASVPPAERPRTRAGLARLLETEPERFRRRVITPHVGLSGLGYVFATFDSLVTPAAWRLARALGEAEAELAADLGETLDAFERGAVAIAHNVAASATLLEAAARRGLALVEPADGPLVVLRTAFIPRTARAPELAAAFLDFVLSDDGQALVGSSALQAHRARWPNAGAGAPAQVIPLGPASLTFLDERKRRRFFETWIGLVLKP